MVYWYVTCFVVIIGVGIEVWSRVSLPLVTCDGLWLFHLARYALPIGLSDTLIRMVNIRLSPPIALLLTSSLIHLLIEGCVVLINCPRCGQVEYIDHVILGCAFPVQVCSLSTIVVPSSSFSDRLVSLLLGVDTALFGRVVAWSLWYFHNQFLWHADTSTVASAFAACFGQDWHVARSTYQQVRPATAQAVAAPVVSSSQPQVGCIKCNIDTAFSENMQQAS
ncbi:hypothetical protein J1N35_028180 [Gossypium stocksii]|uniref:Uncharacterized protein n=1 Tax=Gossypium stocksii TaxID=47602 RepID=A0A9D3UVR2_9ROSI|nr:hypothetical protein J1N35_028180 [Gossypium stocksii]